MVEAVSNATTKMPQALRTRLNERTEKIRYWNRMLYTHKSDQLLILVEESTRDITYTENFTTAMPSEYSISKA